MICSVRNQENGYLHERGREKNGKGHTGIFRSFGNVYFSFVTLVTWVYISHNSKKLYCYRLNCVPSKFIC